MTFVPYHIKSDKGLFCLVTGEIVKLIEKKSNRELQQERKNKGDEFHWKNNMKILWRPWEKEKVSSQQGDNISGSEKKKQTGTQAQNFLWAHATFSPWGKFHIATAVAKKCTKKVCCTCKDVFLLVRVDFFSPLSLLSTFSLKQFYFLSKVCVY